LFFWRKKEPKPTEPAIDEVEVVDEVETPAEVPVEVPVEPEDPAWAPQPPEPELAPEPAWEPPSDPVTEPSEPEPGWHAAADVVADTLAPAREGTERGAAEPERQLSWSERLAGPAIFQPEPDELEEPVAPDLTVRLEKSRGGFMSRLREALVGDEIDGPSWDDVEETLIAGDVGASLALDVVDRARRRRDPGGAEAAVRAELAALLAPRNGEWRPRPSTAGGPAVVLVVGVNGTGKTTTIGKLAARYRVEGHSVILAAADTFRAAAIDQLRIWAERAGAPVVAHAPGADPGAVVYDALDAAVARGADIVIADTAGRLHTKSNLMDELTKVRRIVDKRLPGAEPETLFVLDATTGQNGLAQAKAFHDAVGLTGIVLTKLDSTAKGGIVFAIEESLGVPVRFVGVGEKAGDLVPFDPEAFVAALFA
jgi:fused signal recognition particle receptor